MENNRTNKKIRCALCGKEINGRMSRNHCHPRAISKWLYDSLGEDEMTALNGLLSSQDNIIFVHEWCNRKKEDSEVDIDGLYLPWFKKEKVKAVHQKIEPYSRMYRDMKNRVYEKQDHRCLQCGCDLEENNGVMRRIDAKLPRTEENACIVCHSCNLQYADFIEAHKNRSSQYESSAEISGKLSGLLSFIRKMRLAFTGGGM